MTEQSYCNFSCGSLLPVGKDSSAVEDKRGFEHIAVYPSPVERFELVPLGANGDGMRPFAGFVHVRVKSHAFVDSVHVRNRRVATSFLSYSYYLSLLPEVSDDLLVGNFRIIDVQLGAFIEKVF